MPRASVRRVQGVVAALSVLAALFVLVPAARPPAPLPPVAAPSPAPREVTAERDTLSRISDPYDLAAVYRELEGAGTPVDLDLFVAVGSAPTGSRSVPEPALGILWMLGIAALYTLFFPPRSC